MGANPISERRKQRAAAERDRLERNYWTDQVSLLRDQVKAANLQVYFSAIAALITLLAVLTTIMLTFGQMRISTDALHLDQRAWVAASDWTTHSGPNPYEITVVKNTGKTFALNASGWFDRTFDLENIPEVDDKRSAKNSGTIVPGNTASFTSAEHPFTVPEMARITKGDTFYFYGTVWYDDIFGQHHWSQACAGMVNTKEQATFSACPNGRHSKTDSPAVP
jgi:hypothetical protein